jgi:hypothetical protein
MSNTRFFNPRRNRAWSGIGIDRAAARSNAMHYPFLQPAAQSRLERDRHRSRRGSKQRNAFAAGDQADRQGHALGLAVDAQGVHGLAT